MEEGARWKTERAYENSRVVQRMNRWGREAHELGKLEQWRI